MKQPKTPPPFSCQDAESWFSSRRDDDVPADVRGPLEAHLASCARCSDRSARFDSTLDAVRTLPRHPVPVSLREAVYEAWEGRESESETSPTVSAVRWSRWAAAALILISIGGLLGYLELRFRDMNDRLVEVRSAARDSAENEVDPRWRAFELEIERLSGELAQQRRAAREREADLGTRADDLRAQLATVVEELEALRAGRAEQRAAARNEERIAALEQRLETTWGDLVDWQRDLRSRLQGVVAVLATPRPESDSQDSRAVVARSAEPAPEERPVEVILAKSGSISLRFDRKDPLAIDQLFLLHESADESLRGVVVQQLDAIFGHRVPSPAAESEGDSTLGLRGMFATRVRDEGLEADEAGRIQRYWDYWQKQRAERPAMD